MKQFDIEPIWLTPAEVARRTGKSVQTLANERHMGKGFPYSKDGKSVRYFWPTVHEILQRATVYPEGR